VLVDEGDGLGGKGLSRLGGRAIAADETRRAPMQTSVSRQGQLSGGINHLPAGTGQEAVDESRLKRRILQLLEERGLVESHASREGLGDDAFTLGDEL